MNARLKWVWENFLNKDIRNILIAAVLVWGGGELWSKADPSSAWGAAWTAIKSVLNSVIDFLARPLSVPRYALWFLSLGGIVLAFVVDRRRRRQVDDLEQLHGAAMLRAEVARAELEEAKLGFAVQLMARAAEQKKGAVAAKAPAKMTIGPPVSSLDAKSLQLLRQLCQLYPGGVPKERIGSFLGLQYAAAEKLFDTLTDAKLLDYYHASYTAGAYWTLSKLGRDYCLANQLNK